MSGASKGLSGELIFQGVVAGRLGVSEERVRELRKAVLVEGEDWVHRGSRNLYAASAMEKLARALESAEPVAATEASEDAPDASTEGELSVGSGPCEESDGVGASVPEEAAQVGLAELVPPVDVKKGPRVHRVLVLKIWTNPGYVGGIIVPDLTEESPKERNAIGNGFEEIPADADRLTLLRVRVKTSVNLVRGMVLPCVHIGSDLYEATELPRRKGRW